MKNIRVRNVSRGPVPLAGEMLPPGEERTVSRPDAIITMRDYPHRLHVVPIAPPAEPEVRDDLTEIKGIGPRSNEDLQTIGITTFAQLALADAEDLAARLNGSSPRQVAGWIQQAKERSDRELR